MAARTIPANCYAQPTDTESINKDGSASWSAEVKGARATLKTWLDTFALGTDTFDGHIILSTSLRRTSGNLAIATLTLGSDDSVDSGGNQKAFKAVWTFHSARNDKSVLTFCEDSDERIDVEKWQKETDGTLAKAFKYKDDDGTEHTLSDNAQKVAQKICAGIETVVRFYPILTYTSYYKTCPKNWGVDLGKIRTPAAAAADKIYAPDNINNVIEGFVWLKMQDDIDEQPDSTFKRVQSWWGVSEADGGWDEDLYGDDGWSDDSDD